MLFCPSIESQSDRLGYSDQGFFLLVNTIYCGGLNEQKVQLIPNSLKSPGKALFLNFRGQAPQKIDLHLPFFEL